MSKYDSNLKMDDNTSTGMILNQVRMNSTVLEFGCASGRMTKYMKETLHCKVYIIEYCKEDYDKAIQYAEDGLCEDILAFNWIEKFSNIQFDYIIFADVLEHLSDPEKVLEKAKILLKENGAVLCSIPNAAHGDAILQLYENKLQYRAVGLFDNTHIHLFAYHDIVKMVERAGYKIIDESATYFPLYSTELADLLDMRFKDEYNQILAQRMLSEVYQFIIKLHKREYVEKFYLRKNSSLYFFPENSVCKIETEKHSQIIHPVETTTDRYQYKVFFNENPPSEFKIIPKVKGACIMHAVEARSKYSLAKVTPVNGKRIAGERGDFWFFVHDEPCILIQFDSPVSEVTFSYSMTAAYGNGERNFLIYLDKYLSEKAENEKLATEIKLLPLQKEISTLQFDIKNERHLHEVELASAQDSLNNAKQAYQEKLASINENFSLEKKMTGNIASSVERFMKAYVAAQRTEADNLYLLNQNRELSTMLHEANLTIQHIQQKLAFSEGQNVQLQIMANASEKIPVYVRLSNKAVVNASEHEWSIIGRLEIDRNFVFPPCEPINLHNSNTPFDLIPANNCFRGTIAVQLHLYYTDLIPEFFHYLNQIPYPFDLYISCREGQDLEYVGEWFRNLRYVNDVIVRHTQNRGRDLSPVYVLFREEIEKHDYFLHIHSKKSLYTGNEQMQWRTGALNSLLGNPNRVKQIFSVFASSQKIGLIYPANETLGILAQHWLSNMYVGRNLLASLDIPYKDGLIDYPVGSFFWAKTTAVKKLFDRKLTYEDFPEESGQTDGTLAHALERVVAVVCENAGYHQAIINSIDNSLSLDRSYTPYLPYFRQTREDALHYLKNFECVTFDIFDTLITRRVYQPDDAFDLIAMRISKETEVRCNFKKIRKEAENFVWQKNGARTSIHEIYEKIAGLLDINAQQAEQIKQIEIETELSLCVPRKDMLWIFNQLKASGRDIILISDMYLPSDIIAQMLKKCGYEGWNDLLVSCDCGYRKDDGTMWEFFFKTHDKANTIHVGDNFISDIQMLIDKKCNAFILLSSSMAFSMTNIYNSVIQNYNGTVTSSLILGTFVNEYLCNSPFCFNGEANNLMPLSHEDAAIAMFGPVLFMFTAWLAKEFKNDEKILFVAREGWLLQKLYKNYCSARGFAEKDNCYYLSSRRAASFAAIRNMDDIQEVLSQHYDGPLGKMLKSRLDYHGLIANMLGALKVICPAQAESISILLEPERESILQQAEAERNAYRQYHAEQMGDKKKCAVVDLGYAGSIQYYLSKALGLHVGGYYLALLNTTKTDKVGCEANAVFTEGKSTTAARDIYNMSLPLEGILQAPYGQFKHFNQLDGELQAVYDNKLYYPFVSKKIQQALCKYVQRMASLFAYLPDNIIPDAELAKSIYLSGYDPVFTDLINVLTVQDDYCSGGTLVFNNGSWHVE